MLEIRPTRPEDLPSLGALFADRFGHGLGFEDWHWKYRQVPGEGRTWVAVEAGTVVAHAGALALPARWTGGEGTIWQLVDFAGTTLRSGLRAPLVGLGRKLLADLPRQQDAPWLFGFPSERHFRLGQRVFGYRPLTALTPLVGALPTGRTDAPLEISDRCPDDAPWVEGSWQRCGGLGIRRSPAFLLWRYWARPQRYYRFYRMFSHGQEGFAVFAFAGRDASAAELWLPPLPSDAEWYPSMLAVAADLRAAGLESWRFWPGPGLGAGLATSLGLCAAGERVVVGCRPRAGEPEPGEAARAFPYAMGDYDLV
jgi:hypothetical protein